MRVSSGKYKGRILKSVPGQTTRPTADKVRQAIFNVLMHDIADAEVLDLFAGTGALGIEALSRGAATALFVESGYKQAQVIRQNLRLLGLPISLLEESVEAAGRLLSSEKRQFDLIFADPPYTQYSPSEVIDLIGHYNLLRDSGLLIIEHKAGLTTEKNGWILLKNRKFGKTEISFLTRKEN